MSKTLYRSKTNRVIAGVAGGIAEYFDIDPVLVRVIFVAAAFVTQGFGILVYVLLWIFVPEKPEGPISKKGINQSVTTPSAEGKGAGKIKAAPEGEQRVTGPGRESVEKGTALMGLLLIALGLIFLVQNFWPAWDWGRLWPLLLLLVGGALLWSGARRNQ